MLKKLLILAAGLALATPALAHHDRHKRHLKHPHNAPVLVPAPRVIYAPPRVVYAPPPVYYYYAPPAPVYYPAPPVIHRAPAPQGGVSIRLHFPL